MFSGFLEFCEFLTIFSVGLFETGVCQRDHSMTFIDKFSIFPWWNLMGFLYFLLWAVRSIPRVNYMLWLETIHGILSFGVFVADISEKWPKIRRFAFLKKWQCTTAPKIVGLLFMGRSDLYRELIIILHFYGDYEQNGSRLLIIVLCFWGSFCLIDNELMMWVCEEFVVWLRMKRFCFLFFFWFCFVCL